MLKFVKKAKNNNVRRKKNKHCVKLIDQFVIAIALEHLCPSRFTIKHDLQFFILIAARSNVYFIIFFVFTGFS